MDLNGTYGGLREGARFEWLYPFGGERRQKCGALTLCAHMIVYTVH